MTLIARVPLATQIIEIPERNLLFKSIEPSVAMAPDSPSDFCVWFPLELMG